jgi:hypothetical protein
MECAGTEGVYLMARRSVQANVHRRVSENRQRLEQAQQREEREREALRLLNQQTKKEQTK